MKKTNRKGFTIVELIIVIAVIAILAAVLIPVFSNIVKKANVSSDTQLIRNLNEAVAIDKAEKGIDKHDTMYDAVKACEKQGYLVDRIVAMKSSYNIAWESTTGNFVLLDMEKGKVLYPTSVTDSKEYSVKLGADYYVVTKADKFADIKAKGYSSYAYGDGWTTLETTKGFDAGDVTTITSIDYDNSSAQDIIIRTNTFDTVLNINAPNDTVKHYGNAKRVDLQSIAYASYHEYGVVSIVEIKKGHIELETGSDVNSVYIYNDTVYDDNGYVEELDDGFEEIKITIGSGVDQPKFSRSATSIDKTNGTKVCTLVTDQSKEIYLFQNGIYEQIKVADIGSGTKKWIDQANTTEKVKTASDQLANDWYLDTLPTFASDDTERSVGTNGTATNNATILQEVKDFNDTHETELTVEDWVDDTGTTSEDAIATSKFKGSGTVSDPFLIGTANEWYNLCTSYAYDQTKYPGQYYATGYYKITADIDFTGWELPYECDPENIVIDGQGYTISNIKGYNVFSSGTHNDLYGTCIIKNIKFENCTAKPGLFAYGTGSNSDITFENVSINNCSCQGGAFLYSCETNNNSYILFKNCNVTRTNIVGNSSMACGGYVGNCAYWHTTIDTCTFGGSVVHTGDNAGGFVGQAREYDADWIVIKDSTILSDTVIRSVGNGRVWAFEAHNDHNYAQYNNTFNGTLETSDVSKMYKQGTNANTKIYEAPCSASDFVLNDDGSITYNGTKSFSKVLIMQTVGTSVMWGGWESGGYSAKVEEAVINNIQPGAVISGFTKVTGLRNVVTPGYATLGYSTTDDSYVGELHNGTYYCDAREIYLPDYPGYYYYITGTKNGAEPETIDIIIRITIYDTTGALSGVVSGADLKYAVKMK